jgi:hypothetical protein
VNSCFPSRRNFGESIQFEDCSLRSLDADGSLTKAPQDSPCQFEESADSNSAGDLSVSSCNSASSSDRDKSDPLKEKETEGWGDVQLLTGVAVSRGIAVAIMFLAGPIVKLLKKCCDKNEDTPVPDTGTQNEVLKSPGRGALNRGGQLSQEGAHQSTRTANEELAIQKDIS